MLIDITITGQGVAMAMLGILTLMIGVIILMRVFISSQSKSQSTANPKDKTKTSPLENRHKYAIVDTFKWSSTFLNLGLVLAITMTILAFSWTTYEEIIMVPGGCTLIFDEDIETIPRTNLPPPPPPPLPPPPIIEAVPDEIIKDEPEFVDNTIEEKTDVIAPKQVKKVAPPPPPPPSPPTKEIIDIFKVVEQMPRFPGCEDETDNAVKKQCAQKELLKYIYKNIRYPVMARESNIDGTAVVRFVIETDGSISNTEIVREPGGGLGKEALRVVDKMNRDGLKWIPGQQRGKKVRVQFNLPVKFHLE